MTEKPEQNQEVSESRRRELRKMAKGAKSIPVEKTVQTGPKEVKVSASEAEQRKVFQSMFAEVTNAQDTRDLLDSFLDTLPKDKRPRALNSVLAENEEKQDLILRALKVLLEEKPEEYKGLKAILGAPQEPAAEAAPEIQVGPRAAEDASAEPHETTAVVEQTTTEATEPRDVESAEPGPVQEEIETTPTPEVEVVAEAVSIPTRAVREILDEWLNRVGKRIVIYEVLGESTRVSEAIKDAFVEGTLDTDNPEEVALVNSKNKKKALQALTRAHHFLEAELLEIKQSPNPRFELSLRASSDRLPLSEASLKELWDQIETRERDLLMAETPVEVQRTKLDELLEAEERRHTERSKERTELEEQVRRVVKRRRSRREGKDIAPEDPRVEQFVKDVRENPERLEELKRRMRPQLFEALKDRLDEIEREEAEARRREAIRAKMAEITATVNAFAIEYQPHYPEIYAGLGLPPEAITRVHGILKELQTLREMNQGVRHPGFEVRPEKRRNKAEEENLQEYLKTRGKHTGNWARPADQHIMREFIRGTQEAVREAFADILVELEGEELDRSIGKLRQAQHEVAYSQDPKRALIVALEKGYITPGIYRQVKKQMVDLERGLTKKFKPKDK